ncbi:hypothetical protein AP064_05815 [Candidatus Liberibacter solanacearum]|uniref:Anti-repressor protein n=1 Tax=Candidatus Liberibacter solanacearum TaxID=556287 RepID=A0A0F4VJH9_9HYPH|nr:Rha family transcriptional regulator [Candidatus Liberibacter solanacearum]KJZ81611.1 Anti-repressor protein [Candidatus Liberibacter solanacearum]KQC48640.1 hypothetical protein AP064_05815 [Candidatus Liberibacter solanacearum]
MNDLENTNNVKTMSSREIAEITGKRHDNVLADIGKILKDAEIDALKFEAIYLDKYKRKQREYRLPYREALLVTSGYDAKQRLKIIDRWEALETGKEQPRYKPPKLPSATTIMKLHKHLVSLAKQAGLKDDQMLIKVNRGVTKITGVDQLEAMDIKCLPTPDNDGRLNPTDIGRLLNPAMGARAINTLLLNLGLQEKQPDDKGYILTPKGEVLGGMMRVIPLQHVEGSTQQPRWNPKVIVPYLQELINHNQ